MSNNEQEPIVSVRGLTKTYGDDTTAVDGVSFDIDSGSIVGVLGPNGAGKTTTIKMMLGLVVPTEGSVEIAGVDVHENPTETYEHVGAVLEGARNIYWRLTVRRNLRFFSSLAGTDPDEHRRRHDELLERFDIRDVADTPVTELSRGMKQKVSLVSTLARQVEVLFLDEPTLGLDVESSYELRRELARLAAEEELTVVVSSHDMDVIEEICDRVVILSDGEIITDDSVDDLTTVLRSQTYQISTETVVSEELRSRIETEFEVTDWSDAGHTSFELTVTDDEDLRSVLDVIVESDARLRSIETVEPDLEEIFLSITDDSAEGDRIEGELHA